MNPTVTREQQALYHELKAEQADMETHEFARRNAAVHRFRAWVLRARDGALIPTEERLTPCECPGCVCHDSRCNSTTVVAYAGRVVCRECFLQLVHAGDKP